MKPASIVRVLLAAQSSANRALLHALLEADPQIGLSCVPADASQLASALQAHRPQVLLMDVSGRGQRELQAISDLMHAQPLPVVVCGDGPGFLHTATALSARRAGAVACVDRPESLTGRHDAARATHLVHTLKLMSEVRVVRRHLRRQETAAAASPGGLAPATPPPAPSGPAGITGLRAVGIGASTGGPPILRELLAGLPQGFPAPLLIVQHIAPGFLPGLVEWLAQASPLPVQIASHGSLALPGHVYLAPDGAHLGLGRGQHIILSDLGPENHVRPSVSFLFRSLAQACGAAAIGVLLTGMGRDGADELKDLRARGAVTIAQDEQSSVVHGMAGTAIAAGAASLVLPADRIAAALVCLAAGQSYDPEGKNP